MRQFLVFLFLMVGALSCDQLDSLTSDIPTADEVISLSQEAHGVSAFDSKKFKFVFRNKKYSFDFRGKGFEFTRSDSADWRFIDDFYSDSLFYREINEERFEVDESDQAKFSASINSVIYFATLPYKLTDGGVQAKYKGQETIKSQNYNVVEVSFAEEGGGEDHEDVFYYWFNANTYFIDYFAYQYGTNDGGVRFREAINQVEVGGAVFQDYVNYEVAVGTPLNEIPALFEKGNLKELSVIENKYIVVVE